MDNQIIQPSLFDGKFCKECRQWGLLIDYPLDHGTRRPVCKACLRERCRLATQRWRVRHPEEVVISNKRWHDANKDLTNELQRRWRKANPERLRQQLRRYSTNHREQWRDRLAGYASVRRARKMGASGTHTNEEWQELKARYAYRCLCCGRSEPTIKLTRDHVMPLILGGAHDIGNIQPLCLSCNCRKHGSHVDYR